MLSVMEIVLYALYILGGWQKRIHTEDIAIKCYKIAPSKFSWVKYPQYPDIAPARFALEAAKKKKFGSLVKGESERKRIPKRIGGWMLTAEGIKWIKTNKDRIEKCLNAYITIGDRLASDRKIKELEKSLAFNKFKDYGEQAIISDSEFTESIICTVNTRSEILNDRLEQIYSIAENLRKEKIKKYVNFCRIKFSSLLKKRRQINEEK